MTGDLTVIDLAIVYLLPVAAVAIAWLSLSLVVYVLIRSGSSFAFGQDVTRKFEAKRVLPSGYDRLSFLYVAKQLAGDNCIQAMFLYRMSHFFARRRMRTCAEVLQSFGRFLTHADISPWAEIGPGFYLYHGLGTVIGKGAHIEARVLICQGVTVGGGTTIGEDVKIWAGAQVLTKVRVGARSEVGANAVVTRDFPADSILVGVPARDIRGERGESQIILEPSPL